LCRFFWRGAKGSLDTASGESWNADAPFASPGLHRPPSASSPETPSAPGAAAALAAAAAAEYETSMEKTRPCLRSSAVASRNDACGSSPRRVMRHAPARAPVVHRRARATAAGRESP